MYKPDFPVLLTFFLLFAPVAIPMAGAETVQDLHGVFTYPAAEDMQVRVVTPSGNIDVVSSPASDSIRVELYVERGFSIWGGSRNLSDYRIVNYMRGNEIVASVEPKERIASHRISFSYRIHVPEKVGLDLRSSLGNISVSNIRGSQRLYTNAGNIEVTGSSGQIFGVSNAGDITVMNSEGELRLRVVGGNVEADRYSGAMIAEVVGGDILASFRRITEGVNLESTAGNISIQIPPESYRFQAEGSRVHFSVNDHFSGIHRPDRLRGMFRGGEGPLITLTTIRGIISIETQ